MSLLLSYNKGEEIALLLLVGVLGGGGEKKCKGLPLPTSEEASDG
jgi:hypothetical protein